MIDERIDEHLDLYFEQCSALVSAKDLAVMAATLANNGLNPLTGERALEESYVKNVLSVMHSCGMYDYAGEWGYRIGLAAKSGVGGGIMAVLPGQFGIGTFSPLLDRQGNSCRGIKVCEELSQRFTLHMFRVRFGAGIVVRRRSRGTTVHSKRMRSTQEQTILVDADRLGLAIVQSVPSSTLHAQVPTASGLTALAYCSRCAGFVGLGLVQGAIVRFPYYLQASVAPYL